MKLYRRPVRGLMLWELMMALGLLAVIALVAGQIFLSLSRTSVEVSRQHTAQSAFDQAMRQLRMDVWSAAQLQIQNSRLRIQTADGKTILWQAGDALQRTVDSDLRHWNDLGGHLSFAVNGPTAVLRQEPTPSDSGGELVLPSQALLLKGVSR
jgi:type II secretory pathway pseudopilin PulG